MRHEIKSRYDNNELLFGGEFATLRECVEAAVKARANLSGADLSRADLYGANLYGANLSGAKNCPPELSTPLLMLLDQPPKSKIRAYKLVTKDGIGPFNGGITYEVGKTYSVKNADTDAANDCGSGINLATLDWCLREWRKGYRILIAEFTRKDIAAVPNGSNGKFRVHRCKIVAEKKLDYARIFPPEKPKKKTTET